MAGVRKAFLADIIENIDDDTPRVVFADWLEDNGDPEWAEFIRLHCHRAEVFPRAILSSRDAKRSAIWSRHALALRG